MKVVSLLWVFALLASVATPCYACKLSDSHASVEMEKAEQTHSCCQAERGVCEKETSSDESDSSPHCGGDCLCMCCHTMAVVPQWQSLTFHDLQPIELQPAYYFSYHFDFLDAIWQPPRLCA